MRKLLKTLLNPIDALDEMFPTSPPYRSPEEVEEEDAKDRIIQRLQHEVWDLKMEKAQLLQILNEWKKMAREYKAENEVLRKLNM